MKSSKCSSDFEIDQNKNPKLLENTFIKHFLSKQPRKGMRHYFQIKLFTFKRMQIRSNKYAAKSDQFKLSEHSSHCSKQQLPL